MKPIKRIVLFRNNTPNLQRKVFVFIILLFTLFRAIGTQKNTNTPRTLAELRIKREITPLHEQDTVLTEENNCTTGQYFRTDKECFNCPSGTYNPNNGSHGIESCLTCPVGTYSHEGSSNFTECPKGTYGNAEGLSTCFPCPPGTYNLLNGSSSLDLCLKCPFGTYSTIEGADHYSCLDCPAGTYNEKYGASSRLLCLACPVGTFSQTEGSNSSRCCENCALGSYTKEAGATECLSCPPGTSRNSNQMNCTACESGYYSNTSGSSYCSPCESGHLTLEHIPGQEIGATSCYKCTDPSLCLGSYKCALSLSPELNCTACSDGEFLDGDGCTKCESLFIHLVQLFFVPIILILLTCCKFLTYTIKTKLNTNRAKKNKNRENNINNNNKNSNFENNNHKNNINTDNNHNINNNNQNNNQNQNNNNEIKKLYNNSKTIWFLKSGNPLLSILIPWLQIIAIVMLLPLPKYGEFLPKLRKINSWLILDLLSIFPIECNRWFSFIHYWRTTVSLPIAIFIIFLIADLVKISIVSFKQKTCVFKFYFFPNFFYRWARFSFLPIIYVFILLLSFENNNSSDILKLTANSRIEITQYDWDQSQISFLIFGIVYFTLFSYLIIRIIFSTLSKNNSQSTTKIKNKSKTQTKSESESEPETGSEPGFDTNTNISPGFGSDSELNSKSEIELKSIHNTNSYPKSESESEPESETNNNIKPGSKSDPDSKSKSNSDSESDYELNKKNINNNDIEMKTFENNKSDINKNHKEIQLEPELELESEQNSEIETEKETKKETDTETETDTEKETGTCTNTANKMKKETKFKKEKNEGKNKNKNKKKNKEEEEEDKPPLMLRIYTNRFKPNRGWFLVIELFFQLGISFLSVLYPRLNQKNILWILFLLFTLFLLCYILFKPYKTKDLQFISTGITLLMITIPSIEIPGIGSYVAIFSFFLGIVLTFLGIEKNHKIWSIKNNSNNDKEYYNHNKYQTNDQYQVKFKNNQEEVEEEEEMDFETNPKTLPPNIQNKILLRETRNQKRKLWELRQQLTNCEMEIRVLEEEFDEYSDNYKNSQYFESSSPLTLNDIIVDNAVPILNSSHHHQKNKNSNSSNTTSSDDGSDNLPD